MTCIFGIPHTTLKLDVKALALAAILSTALAPAHAQIVKQVTREEIYQACGPEIRRSVAAAKGTTPKYLLDHLYEYFVKDERQAYLLAILPGLREQAAKFPNGQAAAEVCTIELVTGGVASSSPPPASSQPAPRTVPTAPDSTPEARLAGVLDEELDRFESQAELDIASPTPPRPATPAPTGPGPQLIVQQNEGTPCLEASLAGIHRTSPPQPNAEDNYWYYDIVLRNKCAYSVVWYSEIFTGPAPPPSYNSSNLGPFIYGGAGWPVWGTKSSPASPDYRPVETFTNVPLSPGEVKQAPGAQKVVDLQPVQLWLLSCDAYATDGQRAMTMFNTGAPLSRDGRFFCTPNAPPAVRY